jgi:hypothetical protein
MQPNCVPLFRQANGYDIPAMSRIPLSGKAHKTRLVVDVIINSFHSTLHEINFVPKTRFVRAMQKIAATTYVSCGALEVGQLTRCIKERTLNTEMISSI